MTEVKSDVVDFVYYLIKDDKDSIWASNYEEDKAHEYAAHLTNKYKIPFHVEKCEVYKKVSEIKHEQITIFDV